MRGKSEAKNNTEKLIQEGKIFNLETAKVHRSEWQKYYESLIPRGSVLGKGPNSSHGRILGRLTNNWPIAVDLGMGSGLFLKNLILYDQEHEIKKNYIGIEIKGERVWKAYRKLEEFLPNSRVVLINMFVDKLNQVISKNELSEIYLIYPDPWPKDRHEKHRMTSREFIKMYESLLKKEGCIYFKTDNHKLFEFTEEQFKRPSWRLVEKSDDLLNSNFWLKNIESDYEKVFKLNNKKFYYLKYVHY